MDEKSPVFRAPGGTTILMAIIFIWCGGSSSTRQFLFPCIDSRLSSRFVNSVLLKVYQFEFCFPMPQLAWLLLLGCSGP